MTILLEPELVTAFLDKIVRTMLPVVDYYRRYARDRLDPFANTQHMYNIPGRLMIRNDSSIMVSPETYRDIIAPHDTKLLRQAGTGSIHFCGNGEHLIEPILEIPGLRGIDFGESGMMDVPRIYGMCRERRVALTCVQPSRDDLISGRAASDFPTGVVFVYNTEDINDALEVVAA